MTYIPISPKERDAMLETIGVKTLDDLFKDIPAWRRFPTLNLPPALTEMEAAAELSDIADSNETVRGDLISFLGAGMYNHYIPSVIDHMLRRGEFYTAYTPYQPEISQGTLQSIFEYQSLMSALTGMEVSNASHYDGATAAAEAVNLAFAQFRGKRPKAVVSPSLHPQYRAVIRTYTQGMGVELAGDAAVRLEDGPEALTGQIDDQTCLVLVQYPDFFGRIYDYSKLIEDAHAKGALVCVVANPTALALLKTPASMGADIVVGEAQPLGLPMWYGGPSLGFFTTRKSYVHKMAGRLVGETVDNRGQRAYVLTLTAREQHIKRERATSNICSNQGLLALGAAIYMSALGKTGMKQVANLCYQKAHYAAETLGKIPGYSLRFSDPFFHEFTLRCPKPVAEINARLLDHGILGGYDLGQDYPELSDHMLVAVTEMNSKEEIDLLAEVLAEANHD
ncbi:MAG: putative glycine dehydrogenase (decarboxylating) subunit 1 [Anaerolineaceae bacterium]|nr:aminomethyl-transferring glycine dehydrogenase subunit GcvPA [Anaerolineae bacterium]MBW7917858.1 aminomethyl-transferring glycine dehydrogenase subunit GcvPA [Anaerolineales bacterium]MDL1925459.1 aminomethyl-transferring glycine dehydrogenase subunit GcvPA [Anaerolineae bacterium AMX1]GIK09938.1 MAG: putative glycine dehydrogenase (decarboxylating) subunit 1 [Chloroflexota bacterium]GJQ38959.1 MAG: putative glycine dehydrogenase (decarboxylating) subunit 1 [Anaerolineaceae bacterium]